MKGFNLKNYMKTGTIVAISAMVVLSSSLMQSTAGAQECHPNLNAKQDAKTVIRRSDIRKLPDELKARLIEMARRPHSTLPTEAFAEADNPSALFQYYLLDTTKFEPNIFTTIFPGINDGVGATAANEANCGLPTLGAVRLVVEPKPGLPTDPNDAGAFIDIFTDISNLFVINNESGWYEGWMIHDLRVAPIAAPRSDGHAQFGTITAADANLLKNRGIGHNIPGKIFTVDGKAVHFPTSNDKFPVIQTNVVPIQLSMGAYNCLQQADCHAYWEFNQYTDWVHPLYELPVAGGFPDDFGEPPDAFEDGEIGARQSIIAGSGPSGVSNTPQAMGDDPNNPRDPDRALNAEPESSTIDEHKETRNRFIPSGLANEVLLDAYERLASFEPNVRNLERRLNDAYAYEVSLVDENGDGVIDFEEGDLEGTSDNQSNDRLYIPATRFNRFAVTREINDGLLAPRFATSQRAWVLRGVLVAVNPAVPASTPRDGDDR